VSVLGIFLWMGGGIFFLSFLSIRLSLLRVTRSLFLPVLRLSVLAHVPSVYWVAELDAMLVGRGWADFAGSQDCDHRGSRSIEKNIFVMVDSKFSEARVCAVVCRTGFGVRPFRCLNTIFLGRT